MTNNQHGQVPEALIDLIDAYAETRHRCGGVYNAKTEAARKAVIEDLREALSGVQALSAAQADIAKLRHLYANLKNGGVRDTAQAKRIADGLLAPIIEKLELYQAAPKAAPVEQEEAAQRLRKTLDIDPGDVNDPLHPRYIAGFKSGHAAGRRRAAPAASPTPPAEQQATKETSGGFHVWRDISTAPKDGSRFVATGHNYGLYGEVRHTCVAQWFRGCWMEASDWNETSELKYLTHWMPLPSPPDDVAAPAEQQAAPKAALGVGNSGFDHQTAADFLNGKTVSDEAVRKFVATSRWAHDEKAALSATLLAMHGVLTSREAEIALLKKALLEAEAAPQQEPAFWTRQRFGEEREFCEAPFTTDWTPLYTAPKQEAQEPVAWQCVHDQTDLYYTKPLQADVRPLYAAPQPAPAAQGDALPREDFAWLVVQEACETEPADEDDPECIRILRRDLKSAVLAAFLRHDAARARAQAKEGAIHE